MSSTRTFTTTAAAVALIASLNSVARADHCSNDVERGLTVGLATTTITAVGSAVAVGRARSSTATGLGAGAASTLLGLAGWYGGASLMEGGECGTFEQRWYPSIGGLIGALAGSALVYVFSAPNEAPSEQRRSKNQLSLWGGIQLSVALGPKGALGVLAGTY